MPKSKKPAPKGGKKAAAPKKGLRAPVKGRQRGEKIAKQSVADAGEFAAPLHPTVEEQWPQYQIVVLPKPSIWRRFRSAITGLFVSKQFAEAHPDTTVREKA